MGGQPVAHFPVFWTALAQLSCACCASFASFFSWHAPPGAKNPQPWRVRVGTGFWSLPQGVGLELGMVHLSGAPTWQGSLAATTCPAWVPCTRQTCVSFVFCTQTAPALPTSPLLFQDLCWPSLACSFPFLLGFSSAPTCFCLVFRLFSVSQQKFVTCHPTWLPLVCCNSLLGMHRRGRKTLSPGG